MVSRRSGRREVRKLALKIASIVVIVLAIVWVVFSWFEAEQEVRILCSMFHAGLETEHVFHTLETGSYLKYKTEVGGDASTILVDSLYTLGTSRCVVELEAGRVVSANYE